MTLHQPLIEPNVPYINLMSLKCSNYEKLCIEIQNKYNVRNTGEQDKTYKVNYQMLT